MKLTKETETSLKGKNETINCWQGRGREGRKRKDGKGKGGERYGESRRGMMKGSNREERKGNSK